jgi:hypothetical protein
VKAGLIAAPAGHCNHFLDVLGEGPMRALAGPLLLSLALTACAGRGGDWPTLAPRAGEISPMVPRNLPGSAATAGRCRQAVDCAPPSAASPPAVAPAAPDLPPPPPAPDPAAIAAELSAIEAALADVETAAAPLRARRDAAREQAAGQATDSPAAARAELAESALQAALAPLERLAYRLSSLEAAAAQGPDGAGMAPQLAALSARIAALADQ